MKIFRTVLLLTLLIAGNVLPGTITTLGSGPWSSTNSGAPWPGGTPPSSGDDVIIAYGCTVTIDQPVTVASLTIGPSSAAAPLIGPAVLTFDGIAARAVVVSGNIFVATNCSLIVQSTGTFTNTLSIGGNITNNGTFDMSRGGSTTRCNITFTSTSTQTVSGAGSTTRFSGITLNKGSVASQVTCGINVSYYSFLFTNGTWEQTANTLTNYGSATSVGASGGMIFSGSSSLSCPTSLSNQGIFTVNTSGTLTIGSGNTSFGTSNGTMTLTAGTINVTGRMTMTVSGTTNIQGANININPVGLTGATNSTFECSGTNAGLNWTSGTVTLLNPYNFAISSRGTGRDLKLTSNITTNISGSATLVLGGGSSTPGAGYGYLIQTNYPLQNLTLQTGANSAANGRDVQLSSACTVNGTLTLTTGHLTTSSSNLLTLGSSATVSGGNAGSYIDGPLAWTVASSSAKTFPIGKISPSDAYRPVILNVTQGAGSNVYTAEQKEGADPSISTLAGSLDSKSSVRYLNITQSGTASVSAAFLTMSYGSDDGVGSNNAALRVANDNGSVFLDLGGIGNAPTTGTITSVVNTTTFGDFILAFNTGRVLSLTSLIEGFYNGASMVSDTVTVELHNTVSPFALVDSKKEILNTSGSGNFAFTSALNGTPYYIVIKHRNAVETWSAAGNTFSASALSYDFTSAQSQAYGSNQVLKGTKFCIYSGDVTKDGSVDIFDLSAVDNDVANFAGGYVPSDVNGDQSVDIFDLSIVDNNTAQFVGKVTPGSAVSSLHTRTLKVKNSK